MAQFELHACVTDKGNWRVTMEHPSFWEPEVIEWDLEDKESAFTLLHAVEYAYTVGEGVHLGDAKELKRIRGIWDTHKIPDKGRDLCVAINEVFYHYKGFLASEKQDKEHRRGPMEVLSREIQHLSQLLGWSRQGKLCNGCSNHKDFCRCAEEAALLAGTCDKCGRGEKDCHCEAQNKRRIESLQECFDEAKKEVDESLVVRSDYAKKYPTATEYIDEVKRSFAEQARKNVRQMVERQYVCEFCHNVWYADYQPKGWHMVIGGCVVCPDCHDRAQKEGGYGIVKCGSYAQGRPDPRGKDTT